MAEVDPVEKTESQLKALSAALETGTIRHARRMLNELDPPEIADLLESLPYTERNLLWDLVDTDKEGDVLLEVGDEVRATLIRDMPLDNLVNAAEGMALDDLADFIQSLPDKVTSEILNSLDTQRRRRLEAVLSYPEDSAGGLMNTDTITVRPEVMLEVVLRYLQRLGEMPGNTDNLIVTSRDNRYLGVLPLTTLLTSDPQSYVVDVMNRDIEAIPAVDVIRDEGDHSVMSMAGLAEEEDLFAPVIPSSRRRALWLGINLITAFMASWVVSNFEGTLEKVVAIAVLMNIVASMGGIAGTQTLTLVTRGLALGQVSRQNRTWLLSKELIVGMLNGIVWAVVVGGIAFLWFKEASIGIVIAAAMIINLVVTDIVGLFVFLGLATMFLL